VDPQNPRGVRAHPDGEELNYRRAGRPETTHRAAGSTGATSGPNVDMTADIAADVMSTTRHTTGTGMAKTSPASGSRTHHPAGVAASSSTTPPSGARTADPGETTEGWTGVGVTSRGNLIGLRVVETCWNSN
jgi:hypothetical protein